jgi:hypothetical protein
MVSAVCRSASLKELSSESVFNTERLYSNNVHLPHNKQMQSDAAKAAPLIWALAEIQPDDKTHTDMLSSPK